MGQGTVLKDEVALWYDLLGSLGGAAPEKAQLVSRVVVEATNLVEEVWIAFVLHRLRPLGAGVRPVAQFIRGAALDGASRGLVLELVLPRVVFL